MAEPMAAFGTATGSQDKLSAFMSLVVMFVVSWLLVTGLKAILIISDFNAGPCMTML